MEALDEQREKIRAHKKHLYYLWTGSLSLFAVLALLFVVIIVFLLIASINSINTLEILESWLLSVFFFIYATVVGVAALVLWKEYRESQFKVLRLQRHVDFTHIKKQPEFFNIMAFVAVIKDVIRNVGRCEGNQGDRKHFWRLLPPNPSIVDPSWAYKWKIYTYLEVTGYLAAGFVFLALGYAYTNFIVLALSACIFTLGFFIFVSGRARFDTIWYINPIDLSARPGLREAIDGGFLLLPRWANVGTCNVYLRLEPSHRTNDFASLQVSLEAAGITVEGEKTRQQPPKRVWDEVWNCAFPSNGNYAINLKINSKEANSERVIALSTITHNTLVSGFFVQALTPFLLAVVPVVITAIVTLMTSQTLHPPGL